jgi:catechol 2,3-dioxygenase-like lactoylglutathione lyase family enzyme
MNPIDGIHHITLITGDARANVDFYVRVLGRRLVKKTVNRGTRPTPATALGPAAH